MQVQDDKIDIIRKAFPKEGLFRGKGLAALARRVSDRAKISG